MRVSEEDTVSGYDRGECGQMRGIGWRGLIGILVMALLWASPALAHASESYLPPGSRAFTTWKGLLLDQTYETVKWFDATQSEYEQCFSVPGPTFITAYPRPSDGQYCYYWSLYEHNRAIGWMIVNAGLALGMLDCGWVDLLAVGKWQPADLSCGALQRDFGLFTRDGG